MAKEKEEKNIWKFTGRNKKGLVQQQDSGCLYHFIITLCSIFLSHPAPEELRAADVVPPPPRPRCILTNNPVRQAQSHLMTPRGWRQRVKLTVGWDTWEMLGCTLAGRANHNISQAQQGKIAIGSIPSPGPAPPPFQGLQTDVSHRTWVVPFTLRPSSRCSDAPLLVILAVYNASSKTSPTFP